LDASALKKVLFAADVGDPDCIFGGQALVHRASTYRQNPAYLPDIICAKREKRHPVLRGPKSANKDFEGFRLSANTDNVQDGMDIVGAEDNNIPGDTEMNDNTLTGNAEHDIHADDDDAGSDCDDDENDFVGLVTDDVEELTPEEVKDKNKTEIDAEKIRQKIATVVVVV
jgi:hypothetical protein